VEIIDANADMGNQGQGDYYPVQQEQQPSDLFSRENTLQVIQEYNRDDDLPLSAKRDFWSLISKSIKLGFWKEEDEVEIFFHKNLIKVGYLMSSPRYKYTFKQRQEMNQLDLLVYADFKRGVGMEKYKINERTLQATSVTQTIQGSTSGGGKKSGVMANLRSFFG
jgi:hypothetical protein